MKGLPAFIVRLRNRMPRIAMVLWAVFLIAAGPAAAARLFSQDITDDEIKAALMFKFPVYVRWPDDAETHLIDEFKCCVLGNDRLADLMSGFNGKTLMDKTIRVRRISDIASLEDCRMLFIGSPGGGALCKVLRAVRGKPILTVGDGEGFAENGVIINFIVVDGSVRFEINPEAAKRAGLDISSKLLRLAEIVADG